LQYSAAETERDFDSAKPLQTNQVRVFIPCSAGAQEKDALRKNLLHLARATNSWVGTGFSCKRPAMVRQPIVGQPWRSRAKSSRLPEVQERAENACRRGSLMQSLSGECLAGRQTGIARIRPRVFLLGWVMLAGALGAGSRSVWDGVFTKEQAQRGQLAYARECARCHGENLAGGEASPALVGADFLSHWNGKTAGGLYEYLRKTMPTDDPGNLSTREYSDLVAYIFSTNDFPAGDKELDRDAASLDEIRIEPKR
jgi:quinoprotein glucose dehydrogenase